MFELMRSYRQKKYNPGFNQIIATVRQCINVTINDFFLVIYKWKGVEENSQFFEMPRHGNAKNPDVPSYYRQDCSTRDEVDNLIEKGMSTEKIYTTLNKQSKFSVSETLKDPKFIDNRKYAKNRETVSELSGNSGEAQDIIHDIKEDGFIKAVAFTKDDYITINYLPQMLKDIER